MRSDPRTPVAGRRASDTPLVGRERELTLLRGTVDRVQREREPQLLTLIGVPGIGKTRLVSELARELGRHGDWRWLEGRSLPYGEGAAFWAFCEIVRGFTGVLDSDDDEGATRKVHGAVAAVVPEPSEVAWLERHLRPLVGIDTDDLGSGDRRGEAFTAWRRLLEALAEEQPLVLVFDDLHWADDALLDFVDHVVDWASGVPILVLATARPDLLDRRTDWGGGRANVTALRLSPLSLEETTRLFGALFAEPAAPQRAHADLLERAGGNPFYAEEFARMVLDGHSDRGLPGSVQGLIAARLDGLALDEKELLQNAAVVGRVFWIGPLGDDRPRLERRCTPSLVGSSCAASGAARSRARPSTPSATRSSATSRTSRSQRLVAPRSTSSRPDGSSRVPVVRTTPRCWRPTTSAPSSTPAPVGS
jgi:predicted ATPase